MAFQRIGQSRLPKSKEGRRRARAEHQIFPEHRLVRVTFAGKVTLSEISGYAAWLSTSPSFDPSFSEIVDLREVTEFNLHGDEMIQLADRVDPFSVTAKRAFIVSDSIQNHAAHMHQLLRIAKDKIGIFRSSEEAERWIRS